MQKNSQILDIDLLTTVKLNGRRQTQLFLGELRSVASQLKHQDPSLDEEEIFKKLSTAFLRGILLETSTLFGLEKSTEIFNGFTARPRQDVHEDGV